MFLKTYKDFTDFVKLLRTSFQNQYGNKLDFPITITSNIETENTSELRTVMVVTFYGNGKEILKLKTTRYQNIVSKYDTITIAFAKRFEKIFDSEDCVLNLDN